MTSLLKSHKNIMQIVFGFGNIFEKALVNLFPKNVYVGNIFIFTATKFFQ